MDDRVLLAAYLLVNQIPDATIRFFVNVYPSIKDLSGFSCKDLATFYDCTSESARQHVKVLTMKGYLIRTSYRSWVVKPELLKLVKEGNNNER